MMGYHSVMLHKKYGKMVHRLCSSCISSVQEINEDFIEFSLSTQTWSGFKLSQLKSYIETLAEAYFGHWYLSFSI